MVLRLRKKKKGNFCTLYFFQKEFFKICILSQCVVYLIPLQNIDTLTYQKTFIHFCRLFLKSLKVFSVSIIFFPKCFCKVDIFVLLRLLLYVALGKFPLLINVSTTLMLVLLQIKLLVKVPCFANFDMWTTRSFIFGYKGWCNHLFDGSA